MPFYGRILLYLSLALVIALQVALYGSLYEEVALLQNALAEHEVGQQAQWAAFQESFKSQHNEFHAYLFDRMSPPEAK